MAPLQCESYTFDPRPRYPLRICAKRYWSPAHQSNDADALTLICAHATGYHKEQWEPTLEHLYDLLAGQGGSSGKRVKIREAWCIDAPNHGDSAVLNEELLTWGYTPIFNWEENSRSIHSLLTGLGTGVDVDFRSRRLVGVGHSMGGVSIMLSNTFMPELKFESIILVEPMFYRKFRPGESKLDLGALSSKRRDIWPSYEAAYDALSARRAFQVWDPRILKIYVKHALRDLPTAAYPDKEGVTLKCPRDQEVACYNDTIGKMRAYNYAHTLCTKLPVHFIYGEIDDYLSRDVQDNATEVAAKGQYATLTRIPGVGHLVPQTKPEALADAMFAALRSDVARGFQPGPANAVKGSISLQSRL